MNWYRHPYMYSIENRFHFNITEHVITKLCGDLFPIQTHASSDFFCPLTKSYSYAVNYMYYHLSSLFHAILT